ncbi:MAG TPA: hypothetical protein ENK82_02515 [Campylobacterales bacterium]|nr:hypothetical protein [Campylobacterales bacterium]
MRSSSLEAFVTTENKPFLGRVSMDYVSVEGDKETICIFDDALQAGKQLKTISYEMTTQLNPEIKRVVT